MKFKDKEKNRATLAEDFLEHFLEAEPFWPDGDDINIDCHMYYQRVGELKLYHELKGHLFSNIMQAHGDESIYVNYDNDNEKDDD